MSDRVFTPRLAQVAHLLAEEDAGVVAVIDGRAHEEGNRGPIPGAITWVAGDIVRGAEIPISPSAAVAITCASGYRSTVAISALKACGHRNLINVSGGMNAWEAAGLPVEAA